MKTILPFLQDLAANNNRDWFAANKIRYETAKKELNNFIDGLINNLAKTDPSLSDLKAKDCMFRIFRDMRFSKNKDPYKTNMGAVIAPDGRKSTKACYYLHIDPAGCFLAGGIYMPEPDNLKRIRQEIDYNLDAFEKIIHDKNFQKQFGTLGDNGRLKTSPKGYEADNPAIEYLRNKSFTVSHAFSPAEISKAGFEAYCVETFAEIRPLNLFLNQAIDLTD